MASSSSISLPSGYIQGLSGNGPPNVYASSTQNVPFQYGHPAQQYDATSWQTSTTDASFSGVARLHVQQSLNYTDSSNYVAQAPLAFPNHSNTSAVVDVPGDAVPLVPVTDSSATPHLPADHFDHHFDGNSGYGYSHAYILNAQPYPQNVASVSHVQQYHPYHLAHLQGIIWTTDTLPQSNAIASTGNISLGFSAGHQVHDENNRDATFQSNHGGDLPIFPPAPNEAALPLRSQDHTISNAYVPNSFANKPQDPPCPTLPPNPPSTGHVTTACPQFSPGLSTPGLSPSISTLPADSPPQVVQAQLDLIDLIDLPKFTPGEPSILVPSMDERPVGSRTPKSRKRRSRTGKKPVNTPTSPASLAKPDDPEIPVNLMIPDPSANPLRFVLHWLQDGMKEATASRDLKRVEGKPIITTNYNEEKTGHPREAAYCPLCGERLARIHNMRMHLENCYKRLAQDDSGGVVRYSTSGLSLWEIADAYARGKLAVSWTAGGQTEGECKRLSNLMMVGITVSDWNKPWPGKKESDGKSKKSAQVETEASQKAKTTPARKDLVTKPKQRAARSTRGAELYNHDPPSAASAGPSNPPGYTRPSPPVMQPLAPSMEPPPMYMQPSPPSMEPPPTSLPPSLRRLPPSSQRLPSSSSRPTPVFQAVHPSTSHFSNTHQNLPVDFNPPNWTGASSSPSNQSQHRIMTEEEFRALVAELGFYDSLANFQPHGAIAAHGLGQGFPVQMPPAAENTGVIADGAGLWDFTGIDFGSPQKPEMAPSLPSETLPTFTYMS